MIFAASMGEPPPTAIMTSGWKASISRAPLTAVSMDGSGSTSEKIRLSMPISFSCRTMGSSMPSRRSVASVTICAPF
jgi:hypothetical protein